MFFIGDGKKKASKGNRCDYLVCEVSETSL